jgi:hypothetical protein
MSEQSQERYARLEALKAEASALLKLPVDHNRVLMLAGLRLEHERQLAVLVGGGKIDPTDLMNLTTTIEQLTPAVLPTVELRIVPSKPPDKIACPECGHKFHTKDGTPVPEPLPVTLPPPLARVSDAKTDASPAPANNVTPLRQRVPDSDFHNMPGAPLKRLQPDFNANGEPTAFVGRGSDHIW